MIELLTRLHERLLPAKGRRAYRPEPPVQVTWGELEPDLIPYSPKDAA